MLLFRSKEHADQWAASTGLAGGEMVPFEQVWELSKLWYHNRLSADFHGRSIPEAHQIFEQVGLTSAFWRFDASG